MARARLVVALLTWIAAGLVAASPSPAALLSDVPRIAFVTLLAHATARGISRFVLGYPSQRGGVYPPRTARLLVVTAATFVMACLAAVARPRIPAPWLAELGHLAVLAAAGVALARWCRSSEPSPMYLATALAVLLAVAAALPTAGSTEAAPRAAGVWMRLPQDAAVLWAAWHVAAIRGRARED